MAAALAAAFLTLFVTMAAADMLKTDFGKSDIVMTDSDDTASATKIADQINNTNMQVNANTEAVAKNTGAIADNTKAVAAAQTTANAAISNAEAAQKNALRAITDATKAQTTANNAMQKAEGAMNIALDAQIVAKSAQTTADEGKSLAQTANASAGRAQSVADTANEKAARAITKADTAQTTADTAQKSAEAAQITANTAEAKAETNSKAITATQKSIGDDEFRKVSVQERLEKLSRQFGDTASRIYVDNSVNQAVKTANAYTDSRVNQLNSKVKKLRARADAGIAGATAIGSLAFDNLKANAVSGGLGIAKNKVAGAVGYQRNFSDKWRARAAISVSDNYVQGGTSVGFSW